MLAFICRLWKHVFFPPLHALLSFLWDCSEATSLSLSLLHIRLSQFSIPNKILVSSLPLLWVSRLFALSPGCDLVQCVSRNTQNDNTQEKRREETTSHQLQRWNACLAETHLRQVKKSGLYYTVGLLGTGELSQALDQRCSRKHTSSWDVGKHQRRLEGLWMDYKRDVWRRCLSLAVFILNWGWFGVIYCWEIAQLIHLMYLQWMYQCCYC